MTRVYITGMGIISPLGHDKHSNHKHLQSGQSGIRTAQHLNSRFASELLFGEVEASTNQLHNDLPFTTDELTRTDLLAHTALEEAIHDADLSPDYLSTFSTSLMSSTTVGGMYNMEELYNDAKNMDSGSPYHRSYSHGSHTQSLAKRHGIKGITSTLNTACSASANAIMMGARMIRSGRCQRALVGGVDSLAKFAVNGFNALQILTEGPCKPFDEKRDGLNLGEGAAYLVLESEKQALAKEPYAEVLGYGNTNDAFHPSTLSDDAIGVTQAMQKALQSANLTSASIDYVNTHGTATPNNDQVEAVGMQKVFGDNMPTYNSTKSYTGHTLAAAGAIEAVFTILSIQNEEIYPNLNCDQPISSLKVPPVRTYRPDAEIKVAMSNSFGFAGNCTSLIVGKV